MNGQKPLFVYDAARTAASSLLFYLSAVMLCACDGGFADRSFVFGASSDKSSVVIGAQPTASPTPAPQRDISSVSPMPGQVSRPADEPCVSLIAAPARGLSCLHCNQPEAGAQPDLIVDLLRRSCLKNVAINYLVDGTFSFNEALLARHIEVLTAFGRRLVVQFYLTNGATQRNWRDTAVTAFGVQMPPEDFRRQILSDFSLQGEYQRIVARLIPIISYARSRGAEVLLVPGLEDNLSNAAFALLVQLAREALPEGMNVHFGRNPCSGCYEGNEDGVPAGVFLEQHTAGANVFVSGGVVTNDGTDYMPEIDAQSLGDFAVTLRSLAAVRDQAAQARNVFILWSAERQGLVPQGSSFIFLPPESRTYEVPDSTEQQDIILFLRAGAAAQ